MTTITKRLEALGFAVEGLGGNTIGWVARSHGCELLITDCEGSAELPKRATDRALLTVHAPSECLWRRPVESEHCVALAGSLVDLLRALERGREMEPW